MNTITLNKQQVKRFINAQSDSKRVNMEQNDSEGNCGCLLVHLFRKKFPKDKGYIFAAYDMVDSNSNRIETLGFQLHPILVANPKTYKTLKKIVNDPNWV